MKKAVALGTFDGVHLGHRAVLKHPAGYQLSVITFSFPPKSYILGKPELIMTLADRKKAFKELGAEKTVILDFDKVKDTPPKDFLEQIYNEYLPDLILCGFNFKFGKNASGNIDLIAEFCKEKSIDLSVAPPVLDLEKPISSTAIRNLIASGDIEKANKFIYGGFGFTSTVIHGDKRGRELGFPTVNQLFPQELITPKFGVYFGKIIIDGKKYNCLTNIGLRPTFKTGNITCESYVFDFSEEIYGKTVTIKPIKFIREEVRFDSIDSLKNAINRDIETVKKFTEF